MTEKLKETTDAAGAAEQSGSVVERIVMRNPSSADERLKAALCSTDEDLFPNGNGRVIVSGVLPNKDRIYLGEIEENIFYLADGNPMDLVDRVRFGA